MQAQYDLTHANSFALKSQADYFARFSNIAQAQQLLASAKHKQLKVQVIGAGSNLIFAPYIQGLVLQSAMQEVQIRKQNEQYIYLWVDAGLNWHDFVLKSCAYGHGLENLALIPGTVGAAPVQNIGAYGVEVGEYIDKIEFLTFNGEVQYLSKGECQFAYRDSLFKQQLKGQGIITRVGFKLTKQFAPNLSYGALAELLPLQQAGALNADTLIAQIVRIRQQKLPDPKHIPNAGSFFKNPIISQAQLHQLKQQYPDIAYFAYGQDAKIAAGWLLEQCGFKGKWYGPVGMYEKQALVMVAKQGASAQDIQALSQRIIQTVKQQFNLNLEVEPQALI